jgi:hypothetical protein
MGSRIESTLCGVALAATAGLFIAPREALAFAFTPAMCSACPSTTEYPFQYAVGDKFGVTGDLPVKSTYAGWYMCSSGASDCGDALNYTNNTVYVAGNQNIKQFGFATYAFDLEWGYDYLYHGHEYVSSPYGTPLLNTVTTGSINGWGAVWWRDIPLVGTLQDDPAFLRFASDYSITSHGVAVDRARV